MIEIKVKKKLSFKNINTKSFKRKPLKQKQPLKRRIGRPNIKLEIIQEILSESSTLTKKGVVSHVDPSLVIQSIHQLIKIIRFIKRPLSPKVRRRMESLYRSKRILIYSDSNYSRDLFKLALKKFRKTSALKHSSLIEVGGIKQLITATKRGRKWALVIFVEQPNQNNIKFCLTNRIYLLSFFLKDSFNSLQGVYKFPFTIETLKRYFWFIVFLELI